MLTIDSVLVNGQRFEPKDKIRLDGDLSKPIKFEVEYHVPEGKPVYYNLHMRSLCPTPDGGTWIAESEAKPLERKGTSVLEFQPQAHGTYSVRLFFAGGPIFDQKFDLKPVTANVS
jgi:hypothetical protein